MTEDNPETVLDKVWFRESINSEIIGPLSLVEVKIWYEKGTTLPYNEFSVDGRQWRAMVNRSGDEPDFPFCSFDDESIGMMSIDVAKEDSECVYNRGKMLRIRETSEPSSFLPLFFCPQTFPQCAIRNPDIALRSKGTIDQENTGRLSVVDLLRQIYDNVFENDVTPDVPENKSLDALPWPAIDQILYFLRNDCDYTDLNNLSQVSTPFRKFVKEFVSKEGNRPAIKSVYFWKKDEFLVVNIILFIPNVPFHNLTDLDWSRFNLQMSSEGLELSVTLHESDDHIIQQLIDLLSTRINYAGVHEFENVSEYFPLVARLLRHSTINVVNIEATVDDIIAPHIVSIVARSTYYCSLKWTDNSQLSDPEAFIADIDRVCPPLFLLCCGSSPFFGLPHSFWSRFLNEKLSSGAVECICVSTAKKVKKKTKAPLQLATRLISIKWW